MYKPPSALSPGDIFPSVPSSFLAYPLKVSRKSGYTPPAERGPQEFRRIYSHPQDTGALNPPVTINSADGEECLAVVRLGRAILLTYECTIDADLAYRAQHGGRKGKNWHVAPIFDVGHIPAGAVVIDEQSGESLLIRDVVKGNMSADYFYLDPLPDAQDNLGHYVDFRKLSPVSIEYTAEAQRARLVTLEEDSLNACLAQLMWFFTRAQYLHEPVVCRQCGKKVNLGEDLPGQEIDLLPFE